MIIHFDVYCTGKPTFYTYVCIITHILYFVCNVTDVQYNMYAS